jgi:hypothetical protein
VKVPRKNKKSSKKNKEERNPQGDINIRLELYNRKTVYRMKRRGGESTISQVAGSDNCYTILFSLDQVPGYTELTALFDLYKIDAVRVSFSPMFNFQATIALASVITGLLYTVINTNNNTTTTMTAMEEDSTLRRTNFDKSVSRSFRPCFLQETYKPTTSAYRPGRGYIARDYPTVPHYCLKYGILGGVGGQTALSVWKVSTEFFLSFKHTA